MTDAAQETDKSKRGSFLVISRAGMLVVLGVLALLGYLIVPGCLRQRQGSHLTFCKSHLKEIGTAMEMYSTDNSGHYPRSLQQLVPKYIKELPECEAAGKMSYTLMTGQTAYNSPGFDDYYLLQCQGSFHTDCSIPKNYPQYDGISGLLER